VPPEADEKKEKVDAGQPGQGADGPGQHSGGALTVALITWLNPDRGPSFGFTSVLVTGAGLACPAHDPGCKVTVTFGQRRALVVLDRGPDRVDAAAGEGSACPAAIPALPDWTGSAASSLMRCARSAWRPSG
jgi:hypothetical protein